LASLAVRKSLKIIRNPPYSILHSVDIKVKQITQSAPAQFQI
jgi:hypothetical protein